MATYSDLTKFVGSYTGSMVDLAKVLTAWQWTSLLPSDATRINTVSTDVVDNLSASCGWRDILMKDLFDDLGIAGRRVNFYDVPYQGGHTATELFIDGRWMFFDPTFGTYFEALDGSGPLSMADARANWPNVVVKQASLEGWQGEFVDLHSVSPTDFATVEGNFLFMPQGYSNVANVVGGEVQSLYFGPNSAYYFGPNGQNDAIPLGSGRWVIRNDSADRHDWVEASTLVDDNGRADYENGLLDNGYRWFKDWDQSDTRDWVQTLSYVSSNSVIDYTHIIFDDGSSFVYDIDQTRSYVWSDKLTWYVGGTSGEIDIQIGVNDDGSSWRYDWDNGEIGTVDLLQTGFDANGRATSASVEYDDGEFETVSWGGAATVTGSGVIHGTTGNERLIGGSGSDTLVGSNGIDLIEGRGGNDNYVVTTQTQVVNERGYGGVDTVYSHIDYWLDVELEVLVLRDAAQIGRGNDVDNWVYGTAVDNMLYGQGGGDRISGKEGSDSIFGGEGNDYIWGGEGFDLMSGSAGADYFIWQGLGDMGTASGRTDRVSDFSGVEGDKIHLRSIDADQNISGDQDFRFLDAGVGFSRPGEIMVRHATGVNETWVMLNVDNDGYLEGIIRLAGTHDLVSGDFFL